MNATIIISAAVLVFVVGGIVAVAWWRLAAGMAPYRDEIEKSRRKSSERKQAESVVMLDDLGRPKP